MTDLFFSLSKEPALLREQILSEKNTKLLKHPIIIDEVQKIPSILDEVHWLIENKGLRFILCGSSARKLKVDMLIYWEAERGVLRCFHSHRKR